jgi:ABC-type uncharacterized transport system involved in gliding motility auxiliary subunit
MRKRQQLLVTALSTAAIVLGILISTRLWFRLDLTKNKAYTISRVSGDLYKEIPDQVRITYYLSDRLAQAHPLPAEIEDLLREYAAHSRGKIRYTRRDPVKAGLLQAVEQMGIIPQQIQTVERDEATVATVFTGVAIEYLDRLEVLPVVFSLDSLEYDLSSRIRSLIRGTERELGVIVGDSSKQWSDYGFLNQNLAQAGFRVRTIIPGDEIPDSLPGLFVLGGAEDLDHWSLYRIDRYIRGGGRVLFALDSVFVDVQGSLNARLMEDKGLLAMVSFYGATVKPVLALDRAALTVPFQSVSRTGSMQIRMVRYPHWIGIQSQFANPNHPLTARFGGVDLYWPSPIELAPPQGVEGEVLFSTSPEAWLMTGDFNTNPDMASLFDREAPDTEGEKSMAVSLTGIFPSWFADLPKPVREGSAEELPDMPGSPKPSRIIVVGDTDMAGMLMQVTRGEERNLDFLLVAADWLGNDDDIIGIRNRQSRQARLDRIPDMEKRAAAMIFSRALNVVFIPLLVIFAGVLLALKRRRNTHDL